MNNSEIRYGNDPEPGLRLEIRTVPGVVSRKPRSWDEYAAFDRWEREEFYMFYHGVQAECFDPESWEELPGIRHEVDSKFTEVYEIFFKCGSCGKRYHVEGRKLRVWPKNREDDFTSEIPFQLPL